MATVNTKWILIISFLHIFLNNFCDGTFGTLGRLPSLIPCDPTEFVCKCGSGRKTIAVPVPQCGYIKLLKHKCQPCEDLKPEDVCPKFLNCAECHEDGGDQCRACPRLKFGTWCEIACSCQNGVNCDRKGKCICPDGYEGTRCEIKKGCDIPKPVSEPLKADYRPPHKPTTIIYSCLPNYELRGVPVSTCLTEGQWSSPPPLCLAKCSLLSAPANGRLIYTGSELIENVTAEIVCNRNYRLIGQSILRCLQGGKWSAELPQCEKVATCPDPGDVLNAQRTTLPGSLPNEGVFIQDATLKYVCDSGFEQLGVETIMCLFDGTWSAELPSCVQAALKVPDCNTLGSEVVGTEGIPVRIFCPPECASSNANIWGTSIYRMGSAVCPAAVHSGKITNSGGLVSVINNGKYSHFSGSNTNNVESQSFEGRDDSFRFDKVQISAIQGRYNECPEGLEKLDSMCVYIAKMPRYFNEAKAVCTNLGLQLQIPDSSEEQKRLILLLNSKGISSVWFGEAPPNDVISTPFNSSFVNETGYEHVNTGNCEAVEMNHLQFVKNKVDCNHFFSYVCTLSPTSKTLVSCEDPGLLVNGEVKPVGQINGAYYVGSSVEYSCATLHYLQGETIVFCTANGTWSAEKPKCMRVDACEEPLVPIGGFVNYLAPMPNQGNSRTAMTRQGMAGLRAARLPAGLAAELPPTLIPTTTQMPDSVPLPAGQRRIGTRAMYECESRYYELVGSKTRRCQEGGIWSGRPPSCIPICGRSDSPRTPFVVNGNASDIGQWPWQAGIARHLPDYNQWFLLCGASLLNERWAITAAHCVTYAGTTITIDPDKFRVYLGKYYRDDKKDDEYVQVKKIQEIHIHPDYDPASFDADIALLQLDSPVQLNSRVQPVCLPSERSTRENIVEDKRGVVTGWGINENETYSTTLQQAVIPVVSHAKCEKGYEESKLPLTVTDNMYCAGFAAGKIDACSGDSGGPMVFLDSSSREKKWILEGIVSWGSPNGCGHANQYGGFTTVSRFLDWIHLFF